MRLSCSETHMNKSHSILALADGVHPSLQIDAAGSRYLLAGDDGMLYVLMLVRVRLCVWMGGGGFSCALDFSHFHKACTF